jgi:septal ring factor EnvC (AmiA/AmiB activator)
MIQIPTDNFYKFLSLSSLLSFLIFTFAPAYYVFQIELKMTRIDADMSIVKKEVTHLEDRQKSSLEMLKKEADLLESVTAKVMDLSDKLNELLSHRKLSNDEREAMLAELNSLSATSDNRIVMLDKQEDDMLKIAKDSLKLSILNIKNRANWDELVLHQKVCQALLRAQWLGMLIFGFLTILGFMHWHRWQKKSDAALFSDRYSQPAQPN